MMFGLVAPLQLTYSISMYFTGGAEMNLLSIAISAFSVFYTIFNFWVPNIKSLNFLWERKIGMSVQRRRQPIDQIDIDPFGTYKNGRSQDQENLDFTDESRRLESG